MLLVAIENSQNAFSQSKTVQSSISHSFLFSTLFFWPWTTIMDWSYGICKDIDLMMRKRSHWQKIKSIEEKTTTTQDKEGRKEMLDPTMKLLGSTKS